MIKEILHGREARQGLFDGIEKASKLVTATMGVGGRNILFQTDEDRIALTKDGVTVAKNVNFLENPVEELGVRLLKKASIGTSEEAGDGTTTSTLLTYSLIKEALSTINQDDKVNVTEIKKGIEKASKAVLTYLQTLREELTEETATDLVRKVATISANGDESIGNIIANAVMKVGKDGLVSITSGKYPEDRMETVEGLEFPKGFGSELFITDPLLGASKLKNPYIYVSDTNFDTVESITLFANKVLTPVAQKGRPILIIVDKLSDLGKGNFIQFHMQGTMKLCVVDAVGYGDGIFKFLEDVATITGSTLVSEKTGKYLKDFQMSWLGEASESVSKFKSTLIVDGKGDKDLVANRIGQINAEIDQANSMYEIEILQKRKAKLLGGVFLVNIGGKNDTEIGERVDRADDALRASKCTLDEGILAGGGTSLLRASDKVNFLDKKVYTNKAQLAGAEIVRKAIKEPFFKILENAGVENDEIVEHSIKIKKSKSKWLVYNPKDREFVDAMKSGIVDPFKVTRCALENAVSVCGSLITTEGVIYTKKDNSEFEKQYEALTEK